MTEIKCIKWKNLEGIQMENNTVSVVSSKAWRKAGIFAI